MFLEINMTIFGDNVSFKECAYKQTFFPGPLWPLQVLPEVSEYRMESELKTKAQGLGLKTDSDWKARTVPSQKSRS